MTNERHEKALEAADDARARLFVTLTTNAGGSERLMDVVRIRNECMEEGIRAYLRAMDAVIVPKEPTEEMQKASRIVIDLRGVEVSRVTTWGINAWESILAATPNHFTNGE